MEALHAFEGIARGLAAGALQAWDAAGEVFDRLDTDELPLLPLGVLMLVVWGLLLLIPAPSDERAKTYWSHFAVSGRWIALGASVVPVVVWAAARR